MNQTDPEEISKLQVVCSLFPKTVQGDLYLAHQIKASIEASFPENSPVSPQPFISRAQELVSKLEEDRNSAGIELVTAQTPQTPFSMLEFRANLLSALKRICRFETGLVVLTGLKEAVCPKGCRWSPARKRDYEDAIRFARDFCSKRSRPSSKLSLIIF
ncbi:MAG TPA: hypothetical protein DIV79_10535 [Opitutae bacterium]|nr:hypothetical protein [Opitutaceae bacterium]HCR30442.1 hypothetical protein [Opitutae bacterium]|tara:strand:- start:1860 stop:2336 length:477 start_codon:yes stop_codon:yes gene_type:complete